MRTGHNLCGIYFSIYSKLEILLFFVVALATGNAIWQWGGFKFTVNAKIDAAE